MFFSLFEPVSDRRCTDEKWVYELLNDGCLTYNNQYWCVCSSNYCNGGDIRSIRGNDDCSRNPCPQGSLCLDTYEGFKCMCPPWQPSCTYRKLGFLELFLSDKFRDLNLFGRLLKNNRPTVRAATEACASSCRPTPSAAAADTATRAINAKKVSFLD